MVRAAALLGPCLTERTVNATILGGATMVACQADYTRLGSGERAVDAGILDAGSRATLDVADLESEAAHGYVLLPAAQADDVLLNNGVLRMARASTEVANRFGCGLAPNGTARDAPGRRRPLTVSVRVAGARRKAGRSRTRTSKNTR